MAHYDLEEQEQIDSIKTWWKMYGNLVTGVILAGSLAVIGWQGWNWYQRSQAAQASAIYGVLEQAVAVRDAQRVKAAAGELAEKFGGTSYAALGALVAARQSFEAGDLKTAKAQLSWAADKGKDEIKDLARLRLAAASKVSRRCDIMRPRRGCQVSAAATRDQHRPCPHAPRPFPARLYRRCVPRAFCPAPPARRP